MIEGKPNINIVTKELAEVVLEVLTQNDIEIELGLQSLAAMCAVILTSNAGNNPERSVEVFCEAVHEYLEQTLKQARDPRIAEILRALKAQEINMEEAKKRHKELTGHEGSFVGFDRHDKSKLH